MAAWLQLLCLALAFLQDVPENPAALSAEAVKAYQAKDYARFLEYSKRAMNLAPANPRFAYNVACGEALQGNAAEAVRLLDALVTRKLDLGAANDEDFSGIRQTAEWAGFAARLAELRKPVVRSEVAFRLEDPALVSTGLTVDPATGDTYVASVRQRKIVRRTKAGSVTDFIHEAQDDFPAGDSLAIDSRRRILYASAAAIPYMRGYHKEDAGQTGIFAFDLRSGKLLRKAMLRPDGRLHILNALEIDRAGNVYVADSGTPGIYRLGARSDALEEFVPASMFRSTQGLAFSTDQKTLFIADYSDGLWAVDVSSRLRRWVEAPAGIWLGGMDGLSRAGADLVTVQIGVRPERVLRLRLDAHGARITAVDTLEMNHPDYSGPIQGAVSGNWFYYVANSQLALGNPETGAFADERARPTVVLRLRLK